jgi:hypothetical protein
LSEKPKNIKEEKLDKMSQDEEGDSTNQPDQWDLFWGFGPDNPEEESPEEELSKNNKEKNSTDDKKDEPSDPWASFW